MKFEARPGYTFITVVFVTVLAWNKIPAYYIQSAYSSACGQPADNGGGLMAATIAAAAAPTTMASAGSTPMATGTAQPASTSKAAGNLGFVVSGGGNMTAVLGLLANL
jgi:hypothetical protein